MPDEPSRLTLSPTARRLIRSYGLLILIAIAFLLMAILVREKPKSVPVQSLHHITAPVDVVAQEVM